MEEGESTAITFREQLNQKLDSASASGCYAAVNALIIFWAESDGEGGYREEGKKLGQFLQEKFGFPGIRYFQIPKDSSQRRLRSAVIEAIDHVEDQAKSNGGRSLLIIHYGGHGDPSDDKHAGEERRATWRAFTKDGPSVEWFRIQEEFEETPSDVLLLLDCCHSAQAGRGRAKAEGRIELLSATGSREETPTPGPRSFTTGMIRVMESFVEEQGYVIIAELHTRLMHRHEKLHTVPFHARLRFGPSEKSIRLQPLGLALGANQLDDEWATTVRVIIHMTEQLNDARINELASWLRTDAPDTVTSVQAEEVLFQTARINNFIKQDLSDRTKPLVRTLDRPDLDSIRSAWADIQSLISQHTAQRQDPILAHTSQSARRWSRRFLEEMDKGNSKIIETLEQSVLLSEEYSNPAMIQQAIDDPSAELLGIKDHLELRHIVCSGLGDHEELAVSGALKELPKKKLLQEYKHYGENQSDDEILDIKDRVALLAKVLQSGKSEDFRAMRLCSWEHRKFEYRFIYQFEIPAIYGHNHQSLYDAIKHPWKKVRPSLGQRFDMARCIANAVQHWHSVGWVHQGICSHNIIFFVDPDQKLDYSLPYLHGFDFSRPNVQPSLARYVDDINFNVYRNPDRQGPSRSGHRKSHDLYSLGVVLLEIGLWRRAIDVIMDAYGKRKFTQEEMQKALIEAAETRLDHYAGTNYQRAVRTCLDSDFGVVFDDQEGSILAKAVRERVLGNLYGGKDIK